MKSTLLSCILLLFLSCGNDHKKSIDVKPITIRKDATIVGFWTVCSTTSANGSAITYNICPTVAFYANGRGVTNAGEAFTWVLKKDTLYLSSVTKDNNMLQKGKYETIFRKNSLPAYLELDLTDSTKTIYHLSRTISVMEYL